MALSSSTPTNDPDHPAPHEFRRAAEAARRLEECMEILKTNEYLYDAPYQYVRGLRAGLEEAYVLRTEEEQREGRVPIG